MSSARLGTYSTAEWGRIESDARAYQKYGSVREAEKAGYVSKSGLGLSVAHNTVRLQKGNGKYNARVNLDKETGKAKSFVTDKQGNIITRVGSGKSAVRTTTPSRQTRNNMNKKNSPSFNKNNLRGPTKSYTPNTKPAYKTTTTGKKGNRKITIKQVKTNKSVTRDFKTNPSVRNAYPRTTSSKGGKTSSSTRTTRSSSGTRRANRTYKNPKNPTGKSGWKYNKRGNTITRNGKKYRWSRNLGMYMRK